MNVYPITLLHHFPSSPPPLVPYHPDKTCFTILFSDFVWEKKKKKMPFLVNKATQGVSLWHFHVYMYYSPIWFISSVFLISVLVPFLWWFQLVWKLYIHFCTESTSIIFTFLTSFFYPPPSDVTSLSVTCFSVLPIFHIWETACNFWPCAPG
jgi:hypothetical protein